MVARFEHTQTFGQIWHLKQSLILKSLQHLFVSHSRNESLPSRVWTVLGTIQDGGPTSDERAPFSVPKSYCVVFSVCSSQAQSYISKVNGLHLYSHFLTSGNSKCFTILPHIHPFVHIFTNHQRCQQRKVTASSPGAVRVRCLAQGHLDTKLGGAGD